jgi:hypothetical protein
VPRDCSQKGQEQNPGESATSKPLKWVRHKVEITILEIEYHCSKGTYTAYRIFTARARLPNLPTSRMAMRVEARFIGAALSEGGPMAMIAFTLINGLGVIFLLYMLVQFWEEGRRSRKLVIHEYMIELSHMERPEVVVVTHPISLGARGGLSVIPIRLQEYGQESKRDHRDSAFSTFELPLTSRAGNASGTRSGQSA